MPVLRSIAAPTGVLVLALLGGAAAVALSPPHRPSLEAPLEVVTAPRERLLGARLARKRAGYKCPGARGSASTNCTSE